MEGFVVHTQKHGTKLMTAAPCVRLSLQLRPRKKEKTTAVDPDHRRRIQVLSGSPSFQERILRDGLASGSDIHQCSAITHIRESLSGWTFPSRPGGERENMTASECDRSSIIVWLWSNGGSHLHRVSQGPRRVVVYGARLEKPRPLRRW